MKSKIIAAGLLLAGLHARLDAQAYLVAGGGRMLYDANGDRWSPSYLVGAGVAMTPRLRVGGQVMYTPVAAPADALTPYATGGSSEQYTRVVALAEWDALTFGHRRSAQAPSLFFTGGFGVAHTSGHYASYLPGSLQVQFDQHRTGLSATFGAGVRVPIVRSFALRAGLDFHDDELLGSNLRNWTWTTGADFTL